MTNQSSYKIWITKSASAAALISAGLRNSENFAAKPIATGSGPVHEDVRIPAMFHGLDYHYAYAEYESARMQIVEIFVC